MTTITLALGDRQAARLRQLAERQGATIEQIAESALDAFLAQQPTELSPSASPAPLALPSTLALAGIIADPTVAPLTARELDDILADEGMDTHGAP